MKLAAPLRDARPDPASAFQEHAEALPHVKSRLMIEPLCEVLDLEEWRCAPFRAAMIDAAEKIEPVRAADPRIVVEGVRDERQAPFTRSL